MTPMERLTGTLSAGFLLAFGVYLLTGWLVRFGDWALLLGFVAVAAGLVVLAREIGLYIFHLFPREDFTGSTSAKNEDDTAEG